MYVYLVSDIKNLADINLFQWVLTGLMIIAAIIGGYKIISEFCALINKPIGLARQRKEDHELIKQNAQLIKELAELHDKDTKISNEHEQKLRDDLGLFMNEVRTNLKQFTDNRVHDREQSRDIQKELLDSIQSISEKVDAIQRNTDERFAVSEEKQNQRVQSDIKERIAQSYRRYNITKQITSMELEALKDLISTYEAHGGENSFVHSVVQKEMYTWEVKDTFNE